MYRKYRKPVSRGYERAREHILEAHRFAREIGGSDQDVKKYFFSLSSSRLTVVFDAYEKLHGAAARQYAEAAMHKWRSGRVTMSGMVAKRLFRLLPLYMSMEEKYKLTKKLWHHVGPSSRKVVVIDSNTNVNDILDAVRSHIVKVVTEYSIPDALKRRFHWLSGGDVKVSEKLLNYLLECEKAAIITGFEKQLPVILKHLRSDDNTHISQMLRVGKHELELSFKKRHVSISPDRQHGKVYSSRNQAFSEPKEDGWAVVVVAISVILMLAIFLS